MNTFNRFVVTILFILFSLQVFATRPYMTKIERINTTTLRVNFDQPIKSHIGFFGLYIRGENNVFYTEANSTTLNLIKAISTAPLVINDKVSLTFAVFKPTTVSIVASAGSIQSRYLTNALVS
jgi:hypothetical protein